VGALMAWIESHEELAAHWKTQKFVELSGKSVPEIIGTLHLLWHFTLKNAWKDGDLRRYPVKFIAESVFWKDDPKKLIKLLQTCEFLDGMKVHDWLHFCGDLVKKRIEYKKRTMNRGTNLGELGADSRHTIPNHTQPYQTVPNQTVKEGLFKKPQEKVIKTLIATRLKHKIDSEANEVEFKRLMDSIKNDKKIKDMMAVAVYRATNG